jgi:hypothetical protein
MKVRPLLRLLGLLLAAAVTARGAEVTIITHGFVLGISQIGDATAPGWTYTMADAILDRADGSANRLTSYGSIYVHDTSTGRWKAAGVPNRTNTDRTDHHIVLIFDWATESDKQENGWLEAAADSLFAALQTPPPALTQAGLSTFLASEHNLHFIGHSRGAVLNSRVCNRIGWWFPELKVDHVTSLDPHPAGPMNDFGFDATLGDGRLCTYRNVAFADNYFRRDPDGYEPKPDLDFSGVQSDGVSVEKALSETTFDLNNTDFPLAPESLEHTKVHAWYHGTIDQTATSDGDGVTIPNGETWYASAGMGARAASGFFYSRISSGHASFAEMSGRREPESVPVLFNGNFDYNSVDPATAIPGWSHHGGSGGAFVDSQEKFLKLYSLGSTRTHNPFYLPASVTHLEFDYQIVNGAADERLLVVLNDGDGDLQVASLDASAVTSLAVH